MKSHTLLIRNAEQLVSVAGPDAARSGAAQGQIDPIADGAIYIKDDRIVDVGPTAEVLARHPKAKKADRTIDATGHAVISVLVDCHSHPVFVVDRCDALVIRMAAHT